MAIYSASFTLISLGLMIGYVFSLTIGKNLEDKLITEIVMKFYLSLLWNFLLFSLIASFVRFDTSELTMIQSFSDHPVTMGVNILGLFCFFFFLVNSISKKVINKNLLKDSLLRIQWPIFLVTALVLLVKP